jgi:hypothetical protein
VKRTLAVSLIVAGAGVAALGAIFLPGHRGRLEYVIAIADARPLSECVMPDGLKAMKAIDARAFERPSAEGPPARLLLLPNVSELLTSADLSLGRPPERGSSEALAGIASGVDRGRLSLAGHEMKVAATLRDMGPLFDTWVVMARSRELEAALLEAGWQGRARYLLVTHSWEARARTLARLRGDPGLLPTPQAQVLSPARKPPVPMAMKLALAAGLICAGVVIMVVQLRGFSREEIARRFGSK